MRGSGHYFYRLDSGAVAETNLQLFALYKATEAWRAIEEGATWQEDPAQLLGPCAFVVATMGLSVSQLLGQNPVAMREKRIDSPKDLFAKFAAAHGLGQDLVDDFNWLVDYYDAVRHFGIVKDGSKHQKLETLTVDVTRRCFAIGRRVWDEVLAVHGRSLGGEVGDLDLDDLDQLDAAYYRDVDPGPLAGSAEP